MTKGKLPFTMSICGLDELADEMESFRPSHIISILDPDDDCDDPLIFPKEIKVLSLRFFDLHAIGGMVGTMLSSRDRAEYPSADHADAILDFGRNLPPEAKLLIHCWAGVSRSTAAAFILACLHLPPDEAMHLILNLRPGAMPNRLIVRFSDKILSAGGKMVGAIDGHKRDVGSRSIRSSRR